MLDCEGRKGGIHDARATGLTVDHQLLENLPVALARFENRDAGLREP